MLVDTQKAGILLFNEELRIGYSVVRGCTGVRQSAYGIRHVAYRWRQRWGCGSGTIRNLQQLFFKKNKLKMNRSEPVLLPYSSMGNRILRCHRRKSSAGCRKEFSSRKWQFYYVYGCRMKFGKGQRGQKAEEGRRRGETKGGLEKSI